MATLQEKNGWNNEGTKSIWIARTREEARQKVAKIFGQKIEDQDTNMEYDIILAPMLK